MECLVEGCATSIFSFYLWCNAYTYAGYWYHFYRGNYRTEMNQNTFRKFLYRKWEIWNCSLRMCYIYVVIMLFNFLIYFSSLNLFPFLSIYIVLEDVAFWTHSTMLSWFLELASVGASGEQKLAPITTFQRFRNVMNQTLKPFKVHLPLNFTSVMLTGLIGYEVHHEVSWVAVFLM